MSSDNSQELDARKGGHVVKILALDSQTGLQVAQYPSQQITDPFSSSGLYGQSIQQPPFVMEQLVMLAESHPIHAASIEQKASDIIASGVQFEPIEIEADEDKIDEGEMKSEKALLDEWWESLFEEFTPLETMIAMHTDFETVGWGALEVVRDIKGIVRRLYHVPGHTLRAHRGGQIFAQHRYGRFVYFKRWGTEDDKQILSANGHAAPKSTKIDKIANELLIFRKPSRRSSWYGIPTYVSGIGHITLGIAGRDFNVKFFENFREPRHLIIFTGLDEDVDQASADIEEIWKIQLRGEPHHNIFIPLTGDTKVQVIKMGTPMNEMHFAKMVDITDGEILVAHRMPPDRLGIQKRGFLGGNVAQVTNAIYKDGVVSKGQALVESRLQRFVDVEFQKSEVAAGKEAMHHEVSLEELDITDEKMDADISIAYAKSGLFTLNELRIRLGEEEHEPFGEMTLPQYLVILGAPAQMVAAAGVLSDGLDRDRATLNGEVNRRLDDIDGLLEELLGGGAEETHAALAGGGDGNVTVE